MVFQTIFGPECKKDANLVWAQGALAMVAEGHGIPTAPNLPITAIHSFIIRAAMVGIGDLSLIIAIQ